MLFHTGWDRHWGTDGYGGEAPFLTAQLVATLVESRPALVGIDSENIDDAGNGNRPAHSMLLANGILIVEHLTNLDALPDRGGRFFAVPPKVHEFGTFPIRAFAICD